MVLLWCALPVIMLNGIAPWGSVCSTAPLSALNISEKNSVSNASWLWIGTSITATVRSTVSTTILMFSTSPLISIHTIQELALQKKLDAVQEKAIPSICPCQQAVAMQSTWNFFTQ